MKDTKRTKKETDFLLETTFNSMA